MRRPKPGDILCWALAVVAAVLFVFFLLVLGGVIPIDTADPSVDGPAQAAARLAACASGNVDLLV